MAVWQRAAHHDGLLTGRRDFPALEQRAQAFDDLGRPIGQVGDRALFDFSAVAIALAAEWRAASSGSGRIRYTWRNNATNRAS